MTAPTDIDIDEMAYQYLKFLYILYGDIQFSYHVYSLRENPHKEQMGDVLINLTLINSGYLARIDFDSRIYREKRFILTKKFYERLDKE